MTDRTKMPRSFSDSPLSSTLNATKNRRTKNRAKRGGEKEAIGETGRFGGSLRRLAMVVMLCKTGSFQEVCCGVVAPSARPAGLDF